MIGPHSPDQRSAVARVRGLCQQITYRIPGDHSTWDAYHEGQHDLAAAIEDALDHAPTAPATTTSVLDFAESLLLMEGLDQVADQLRAQVAAGDTGARHDLERADRLSTKLAQAASIELALPAAPARPAA